ncbi:hypothetical protein FHR66_003155 [Xanthomonas sp. F4]|nr:hypothetical protein [Xanthomonas sp. 3307]
MQATMATLAGLPAARRVGSGIGARPNARADADGGDQPPSASATNGGSTWVPVCRCAL